MSNTENMIAFLVILQLKYRNSEYKSINLKFFKFFLKN